MAMKEIVLGDLDSLEFEKTKPEQAAPTKKGYVNNKELQEEFLKYYAVKQKWIADGNPGHPPLTDKIGKAIMDIAVRRTYSRNFISYTQHWKEEMISDAIETCVRYVHNYNPEKYNNPFAYITQMVTNAILSRIKLEKTHTYLKYKMFDNARGVLADYDETMDEDMVEGFNETSDMYSDQLRYIADFEEKYVNKAPKDKRTKELDDNLTNFLV